MLPDSSHVQATQSGLLPLHHSLSATAKTAHVLDGMTNSSLISIGQLCDDDCVAILDKQRLFYIGLSVDGFMDVGTFYSLSTRELVDGTSR